jgi:hypothetical protein
MLRSTVFRISVILLLYYGYLTGILDIQLKRTNIMTPQYNLEDCETLRTELEQCIALANEITQAYALETGEQDCLAPTLEFLGIAGSVLDGCVVALEDDIVAASFQEYFLELKNQLKETRVGLVKMQAGLITG